MSETAELLAVAAAYDQRTVGDLDVGAWHATIGDLPYPDARTAVIAHYRHTSRRLMPADVFSGVRSAREARANRPLEVTADPDDTADYQRQLQAAVKQAGDGGSATEALARLSTAGRARGSQLASRPRRQVPLVRCVPSSSLRRPGWEAAAEGARPSVPGGRARGGGGRAMTLALTGCATCPESCQTVCPALGNWRYRTGNTLPTPPSAQPRPSTRRGHL